MTIEYLPNLSLYLARVTVGRVHAHATGKTHIEAIERALSGGLRGE